MWASLIAALPALASIAVTVLSWFKKSTQEQVDADKAKIEKEWKKKIEEAQKH